VHTLGLVWLLFFVSAVYVIYALGLPDFTFDSHLHQAAQSSTFPERQVVDFHLTQTLVKDHDHIQIKLKRVLGAGNAHSKIGGGMSIWWNWKFMAQRCLVHIPARAYATYTLDV
jgi:hypothetical protein